MGGKAKSYALAALARSIVEHEKVLKRAQRKASKRRPHGKQRDRSELNQALPGTLADPDTRRAAAEHLIDALLHRLATIEGSGCRTFLATFAWDEGIIPPDQTKLPDLKPLLHKVYKVLAEFGLSGVLVVDFALFDPGDGPPYIHIHIHVICWTNDPAFRPKSVRKQLRKRRAFRNSKFKSVDIRSRKEAANRFSFKDSPHYAYVFAKLDRGQTKASIAWLGQYLWAAPAVTKRMIKDAKTGKRRIVNLANSENAEGLHVHAEGLMRQLPIYDCIAGVGAGCAVRREWKKAVRESTREPSLMPRLPSAPRYRKRPKNAKRPRRSFALSAHTLQRLG